MSTEFIDVANTENIQRELWIQCENEEFCDVALIAGTEEKIIPAHSCVLSAASKYFKEIFQRLKYENQLKEVKLPSVDSATLQSIVKYCYIGRIKINRDIAVELLKTAHELLLHRLVTGCANFLVEQLHSSNCFQLAHLAQQYHCETLLQKARDYSLEHFTAVSETDDFLRLNAAQLDELLASDKLNVPSQENVFNSLLAWTSHNPIEREKHQAELLKLVRLPLLKTSFLKEHVKPICTSAECREIYIAAIEERASLNDKNSNGRILVKPKKSNQLLMGITLCQHKMHIHYHCPQQLNWMKWSKDLEYHRYPGLAIMEDNVFIVGGEKLDKKPLNTVVCLNLKTMKLKKVSAMTAHRRWCGAAVLNGFLYAVGGANKDGNSLYSVEKWNQKNNTWSEVAPMKVGRREFGAAILNEKLYAIGGYSNCGITNSAECYDPQRNVWMSIASMHEVRLHFGISVSNGLLYAVGGNDKNNTVERYNPKTNCWTMLCSLNNKLEKIASCTLFRNKVTVCCKDRIEEYHEETDKWITSAALKVLQNNHRIFTYYGELLTTEFVK